MDARNDAERRKTLLTLIELAEGSSPSDCWDDARAEDLLRSQSNPDEVRELGMSEEMIVRVFGAPVGGRGSEESGGWGVGSGGSDKATASHVPSDQSPVPPDNSRTPSEKPDTSNSNSNSHPPPSTPHPPSFTIRVSARFKAAHFLREYRGISEPLHGHSYLVEADLAAAGGGVDADAIAVDFVSARRNLEALAKTLDYGCINDVPPFDKVNPSAENVAQWFAEALGAAVADEKAVVRAVTIWEGPVNSVTFRP